jgi:hypothetical protein
VLKLEARPAAGVSGRTAACCDGSDWFWDWPVRLITVVPPFDVFSALVFDAEFGDD